MKPVFYNSIEPYWENWIGGKMDWYKVLWSKIGGRPWTYILRDLWHKAEVVWIILLVSLGVWLGHHFDWLTVLEILGVFTIGFIFGHLFWGKDYIPSQRGE